MNLLKNGTDSPALMQSLQNAVQSVMDRVTESPKFTVAASTFGTATGVGMAAQWLTGVAAGAAVCASLIATIALARLHWLKGEQAKEEAEKARLETEILRKKLADSGVSLEEDHG